jgi:SAM-dependent methyltransferase
VKSGSVDIWYSYSVLENVPPGGIAALLKEAVRVLAPTGMFFSVIGCQDPFAGGARGLGKVNYLRYSDKVWSFWTENDLAYNNRLRECDFVDLLQSAGLVIVTKRNALDAEDLDRVKRMTLGPRFAGYSPEQLAIHRSELTAQLRA